MSRSYKKSPIDGIAVVNRGMSEYRKERAGRERAAQRNLLANAQRGDENAANTLEVEQEPWDEWMSPRDGLQYLTVEYRRRNPRWNQK